MNELSLKENKYVLELNGISKSFPGVIALDKVSMKVRPGIVHAICGENGAGKSTLIKIVNGIYQMDEGEIIYKGEKILPQNPKQMLDIGIATIHQELSPIPDMSIAENIFLGREPLNKLGNVNWKKLFEDAQTLLDEYGFNYNPKQNMRGLTVSDAALIEIIKAVSRKASVIIMDEPTSSISDSEAHLLFDNIKRFKEEGVAIIYISHKMDEIFSVCDEVTILRDGKWVHNCRISEINKDGIIKKMVGREIDDQFPKEQVERGEVILELKNFTGKKFSDINFNVRSGEIVGFAGLVGAGRTELFRSVFGLDNNNSGEIFLEGEKVIIKNPKDAISKGVVLTSEDRKKEGVVLIRSIRENISLASLEKVLTKGFINIENEKRKTDDMVNKLSIKATSPEAQVFTLSGGNQQKVVLAKWLLLSPKVLILDEPTRGIDVGAKYEIYRLMTQLVKEGVAIVMISSEMPELMGMSDRIYVMSQGNLTSELNRQDFSQEKIMENAVKGFEND